MGSSLKKKTFFIKINVVKILTKEFEPKEVSSSVRYLIFINDFDELVMAGYHPSSNDYHPC